MKWQAVYCRHDSSCRDEGRGRGKPRTLRAGPQAHLLPEVNRVGFPDPSWGLASKWKGLGDWEGVCEKRNLEATGRGLYSRKLSCLAGAGGGSIACPRSWV